MEIIRKISAFVRLRKILEINEERKFALVNSLKILQKYGYLKEDYCLLIRPPSRYSIIVAGDVPDFKIREVGANIAIRGGFIYELTKRKI